MRRAVFVPDVQLGHIKPTVSLARAVKACAYDPLFWVHSSIPAQERQFLEATGFDVQFYDFDHWQPLSSTEIEQERFCASFKEVKFASVAFVDELFSWIGLLFHGARVPYAIISTSLPIFYDGKCPPCLFSEPHFQSLQEKDDFDKIWRRFIKTDLFSAWRERFSPSSSKGQGPDKRYKNFYDIIFSVGYPCRMISFDTTLFVRLLLPKEIVLASAYLDFPVNRGPDILFSGHLTPSCSVKLAQRTLIIVSLGSQTRKLRRAREVLLKLIDFFRNLEHDVLMSIGDNLINEPEFKNTGPRIRCESWIQQEKCLESAQLLITHGGLNSVSEAVISQVPMLVIPMCADEYGNASRVKYLQIGDVIKPEHLCNESLKLSVNEVLCSKLFRDNLKSLSLRMVDERARFENALEKFLNEMMEFDFVGTLSSFDSKDAFDAQWVDERLGDYFSYF